MSATLEPKPDATRVTKNATYTRPVCCGDQRAPRRPRELLISKRNWRATVDEDGHYCFAVPL
jgi:hypothetical protein